MALAIKYKQKTSIHNGYLPTAGVQNIRLG